MAIKVIAMNVIEIMTAPPITIRPERSLYAALDVMGQHHIKHLLVISDHHPVGVVSEQDCRQALNLLFAQSDPHDEKIVSNMQVRSIMSCVLVVVEPDTPVIEAARLILTHHIGCLPVLRGETLVGIITRSDILVAFTVLQRRFNQLPGVLNCDEAHPLRLHLRWRRAYASKNRESRPITPQQWSDGT